MSNEKETLLGSIELTKLNKVFIKNFKGQNDVLVPCLCIPMADNQIYEFPVKNDKGEVVEGESSNRFGFEFRQVLNTEKDQYGRHGFIAKKLTKEEYDANKGNDEFLKSSQPILGNFIRLNKINPDASGPEIPSVDPDTDDLPF